MDRRAAVYSVAGPTCPQRDFIMALGTIKPFVCVLPALLVSWLLIVNCDFT